MLPEFQWALLPYVNCKNFYWKFVDVLYFFDYDAAVFMSTRRNFFDDDTSDLTSTTSQCFFQRHPTLNVRAWLRGKHGSEWSQNMCIMLSAHVLKTCMLLEFCEHTARTMPHYRRSADWLSSPSWLTAPVLGGGTPAQLIDNGLKHSWNLAADFRQKCKCYNFGACTA